MGLDAFVPCRCWEEGLTTAPPVDRADIYLTDWMPDMDLPYDGNEELWHRFDGWASNCCPHPDMEHAAAHVGNWSDYRQFQWALGAVGWDRFPALRRVLPDANGGEVEAADADQALAELSAFNSVDVIGVRAELYDGTTGDTIATENPAFGGRFMLGPSYEIGINSNGLFVLDRPHSRLVYRAQRIGQRAGNGGAWLADLDHPEREEHWVATTIAGGASQLLTRPRTYRPEDFGYAVAALTMVFQASVEIGRPVVWT